MSKIQGRNPKGVLRIESLRVENYRALRKVELVNLTPMTVLLGPNGSGKSTVFDVFNFLSECFQFGLRHAWDRRGLGKELKSRGATGPNIFELKYREKPKTPIITYHLAMDDGAKGPEVVEEWLQWRRGTRGQPFRFLEFRRGIGKAVSGEEPDEHDKRIKTNLRSPDLIAVNTLGQFTEHPRAAALREFITDWYVSYLSIDQTRGGSATGVGEYVGNIERSSETSSFGGEQNPGSGCHLRYTLHAAGGVPINWTFSSISSLLSLRSGRMSSLLSLSEE